jgi:hypothetical protein
LTDIASGWTEFFVLLKKGEADVIAALGYNGLKNSDKKVGSFDS